MDNQEVIATLLDMLEAEKLLEQLPELDSTAEVGRKFVSLV